MTRMSAEKPRDFLKNLSRTNTNKPAAGYKVKTQKSHFYIKAINMKLKKKKGSNIYKSFPPPWPHWLKELYSEWNNKILLVFAALERSGPARHIP